MSQRGLWTCEELHSDSETLHQRATVIIRNAKDKLKENTVQLPLLVCCGHCQMLHSKDLDVQDLHPKRRLICHLTLTTTWFVQEPSCFLFFYTPVGLETIFTLLSFYWDHVFTEKLHLLCAREKKCCKSNIVFTDQGILLYYFIHIIFYKLLTEVHFWHFFCMILHSKFTFVTK